MKLCSEGVDNLRCAIVERAAMDYLEIKKSLHKIDNYGKVYYEKDREYFVYQLESVMNFFKSKWYEALCDIDRDYLISRLEAVFEEWKTEYDREKRKNKNRKVRAKAG